MKTKIAIIAILLFLSLLPTSARAISEDQSIAILENTAKTDTSLSTTDRTAILNALTSVRINLAAAKKLDAEAQVLDALVAAEKAGIGTNPVFATAHLVNVARGKEFDITELERESKGAGAIARCLRAGVSWQDLKSVIRTSNAEDFLNIGDGCLLEVAGTAENFRAGVIKVKALYSNTKSPDVLPLPLGDYVFGMDAFFRNNAIASVLDEEQTSGRLMSDREWAVRLFAASDAYANQGEYALAMSVLQRVRDWYGDDATTTFSAMTNHDRDGIELLALCTQGVGGGPGATLNQIRDFTARYKLGDKLDQEATAIKNCMEPSQTEIVNAPVSGQEGITRYDVALQTKVDALGRAMFTNPVWLAQLLDANVKDKNAAILKVRDAVRAFEARKSIVKGAGGLPADATNWDVMALATVRQQKYIGFQQSTRTTPITQLGEVAHGTFLCVGSFLDLPFLALGLVSGGLGYVGKLAMSSYIAVEASISTTESVSRWTTLSLTEKTQTVCGATVGLIASTHVFKTIPKAAEQLSKTEPARFAEKRVVARVAEAVKTGFIKARPALERVTLKLPSALRPKFQTYLARLDALDSAVLQCSGCVIVNGQTRIEANKVFGDTVAEQLEAIRSEKYLPTFKELEASANAIRSVEFRTISTATDLDVYIKDVASITEPDVVIPKSLLQAFADQRVLVAKEFYFRNARLKVLYPDAQDRIDIRYSRWLDPNIDYFNSEVGAVGKDVSGFAYAINQIPGPKIFLYRGAADLQLMTETAALAADIKPQTSGWSFNRKMLLNDAELQELVQLKAERDQTLQTRLVQWRNLPRDQRAKNIQDYLEATEKLIDEQVTDGRHYKRMSALIDSASLESSGKGTPEFMSSLKAQFNQILDRVTKADDITQVSASDREFYNIAFSVYQDAAKQNWFQQTDAFTIVDTGFQGTLPLETKMAIEYFTDPAHRQTGPQKLTTTGLALLKQKKANVMMLATRDPKIPGYTYILAAENVIKQVQTNVQQQHPGEFTNKELQDLAGSLRELSWNDLLQKAKNDYGVTDQQISSIETAARSTAINNALALEYSIPRPVESRIEASRSTLAQTNEVFQPNGPEDVTFAPVAWLYLRNAVVDYRTSVLHGAVAPEGTIPALRRYGIIP